MKIMIETRRDIINGLHIIKSKMSEVQRDLDMLRLALDEGSEERLYLGFIIDEQDRQFEEATQWFEDLIHYMETGTIKEPEYDEETERMFREQEEGLW